MDARPIVVLFGGNDRDQAAAARLLAEWGFAVNAFTSPQALLESIKPNVPGCIVIDCTSPESGGMELCRRLSEARSSRPFIVLSDRGDAAQSLRAIQFGASEVVAKPFQQARLVAAVRHAISRDAQLRQVMP